MRSCGAWQRAWRWPVAAALAGGLVAGCGGEPPPSFLLVSLDATRPDHLGAYGYGRDTTPFLDELAARGFLFEQAVAPSLNTLISHASLLTGLPAWAHGATYEQGGRPLHGAFTTLAEDLAAGGWETAAFVAHGDWLNSDYGIDQGFDTFSSGYRPAEPLLAEAAAWLAQRPSRRPWFLFLHLYDVHSDYGDRPYDAPPPFRGRWARGELDLQGRSGSEYLEAINDGEIEVTAAEIERIRDQYDEGLAYTDHALRSFFEALPAERLEHAWVIVVADHGEAFGEHGKLLHASLHDEIMRIPFLVVPPPASAAARAAPARVTAQVRLTDVRPTVLLLAGLPAPEDCLGADLTPCLEAAEGRDCRSRPATFYRAALRHRGHKLIRVPGGPRLFDLNEDPGETVDLGNLPETRRLQQGMQRLLTRLVAGQRALREQVLAGEELEPVGLDPEAEERLRALGYLD